MKIYSLLLILGIPLTLGAQPIDLGADGSDPRLFAVTLQAN